ncbi:MAG: T9SS type A sorting domain-containing protein, partial [Flavobacteriales bacterium]
EDQLNISLDGLSGEIELKIIDLSGRTMRSETHTTNPNQAKKKLNINGLSGLFPGTYVLKISNQDGIAFSRLLLKK